MFILNITFVMEPESGPAFVEWMECDVRQTLFASGQNARNPRLQTVLEAGGERPGPEHGLSIALQVDFNSEEEAIGWHDSGLPPVLASFREKFGPHSLFFVTLLESMAL